MATDEEIGKLK